MAMKSANYPKTGVMATVPFEGRTAIVIKAEGPGGNVGKPGDAVEAVIEENEGKIGYANHDRCRSQNWKAKRLVK